MLWGWFLTALATGFRIYDCYTIIKSFLDEPDVGVEKLGDKIQGLVLSKINDPSLKRLTQIVLNPVKKEIVGAINFAMGLSSKNTTLAIGSGLSTVKNVTCTMLALPA